SQIADLIKQIQQLLGGGQTDAAAPAAAPGADAAAPAADAAAPAADALGADAAANTNTETGAGGLDQAMSLISEMLKMVEQIASMLQSTRRQSIAA
ncbi:MAG TPA: hypothetical protein VK447_02455, partial [Myxococcaceae bacterium]|nr:hypothetical protein [Myxococcaceae bacterium]